MTTRLLCRRRFLSSVALALFGGFTGCLERIDDLGTSSSSSSQKDTSESASTSAESKSTSAESESTSAESESTPTAWTPPATPRKPTEDKREGRINDVDFINTKAASNANGYTDFDLQVGANTWMKDVDPPKDESGEPYFAVEINDMLVARTDTVSFRKEGSFTISIKRAALQRFDSGTLTVRILLFEEDSHSDDLYATWSGTIEYHSA